MNNSELKKEMSELQKDLQKGLDSMLSEIGNKLKPHEKDEIQKEVNDIQELLKRLESGLIWLALFGRTSTGKSAIANSLMDADIAEVGVEHDLTKKPHPYVKEPWCIVDVPGIMGEKVNENIAIEEASKAHGYIYVVDGEPFSYEIELFDLIQKSNQLKKSKVPTIVFFNKEDKLQLMPTKDREIIKQKVYEKMRKYVASDADIIYGSAELYDRAKDIMVRQKLPQLEDRLYEDASTLGQMVNIIDVAKRGEELTGKVRDRILEIRRKVARKAIAVYAIGQLGAIVVPLSELIAMPGILAGLTYSLVKIMGEKENKNFDVGRVTKDILQVCGEYLALEFIGITVIDTIADFLGFGIGGAILDLVGMSYFKYRRTLIFGEAVLLYIENDFSFGNNPRSMILQAKDSAKSHYEKFKSK